MHQFTSSLRYADQSWWSQEPTYSRMIAGVLDRGYRLVRQGDSQLDDFGRAASVAENHLQSRMSPHQRLRLYFVLAKANAGVSWFEDAIGWLDQTRSLAMQLSDLDMQLELLSLRATYNRARLHLNDAIADRVECLDILDAQADRFGVSNPAGQLDILAQLATYTFFVGQPTLAEAAIKHARALAPLVSTGQFDMAAVEWVQAHLYRTYGDPRKAFYHIQNFYAAYTQDPEVSLASRDRMEIFVAAVALEWAERLPQSRERATFLALASKHLDEAEDLAKRSLDAPGLGLVRIERVHQSRLIGNNVDRIDSLEAVIRLGKNIGDVALEAQAYTALGDEYQARHETGSARGCYHLTQTVLQGGHVPVLAIPARRALLWMEEMCL